jgi:hypothetical protein
VVVGRNFEYAAASRRTFLTGLVPMDALAQVGRLSGVRF